MEGRGAGTHGRERSCQLGKQKSVHKTLKKTYAALCQFTITNPHPSVSRSTWLLLTQNRNHLNSSQLIQMWLHLSESPRKTNKKRQSETRGACSSKLLSFGRDPSSSGPSLDSGVMRHMLSTNFQTALHPAGPCTKSLKKKKMGQERRPKESFLNTWIFQLLPVCLTAPDLERWWITSPDKV